MSMSRNVAKRNVFALCAAAMVAVMAVAPCLAAEPESGRYQWQIVPAGNGAADTIYVIDTETGEIARVDRPKRRWIPVVQPLDWSDIRKQRDDLEKQEKAQAEQKEKEEKAAQAKREALLKSFSEMSLEEQVAWAKSISILKYRGSRYTFSYQDIPGLPRQKTVPDASGMRRVEVPDFEVFDYLKGERVNPDSTRRSRYKSTDDGLVVQFNGVVDGGSFEFSLSHTKFDNFDYIFPAPETIIEDVKAEIKRQAEKQKEGHAENH